MNLENAVRRPYSPVVVQRGIHLVHSRDWPTETRASVRKMALSSERQVRNSREKSVLLMPMAWAGRTMRRWMRER